MLHPTWVSSSNSRRGPCGRTLCHLTEEGAWEAKLMTQLHLPQLPSILLQLGGLSWGHVLWFALGTRAGAWSQVPEEFWVLVSKGLSSRKDRSVQLWNICRVQAFPRPQVRYI